MDNDREGVRDSALAEIAAAVEANERNPSPIPFATLRPARAADRLAAGFFDCCLFTCVAPVLICCGILTFSPGDGFAFIYLLMLTVAVYTGVEALGQRTLGQSALDLYVIRGPNATAGALGIRWMVKCVPLLAMLFLLPLRQFDPFRGMPFPELCFVGMGFQILFWIVSVWRSGPAGRDPIYDRLAGVMVVRARKVDHVPMNQGFDVLPAALRPVLPIGPEHSGDATVDSA